MEAMDDKPWMKQIEKNEFSLDEIIKSIESFKQEHWYEVKSNSHLVHGKLAKICWVDNTFEMEIACAELPDQATRRAFLEDRSVWLEFSNLVHTIKADYASFSSFDVYVAMRGYTKFTGRFKKLYFLNGNNNPSHYCAVIKCPDENFLGNHLISKILRIGRTEYFARIIEVIIENTKFDFFLYGRTNIAEKYFFIECKEVCEYKKFTEILQESVLALTYITGIFPGKEIFILENIFDASKFVSVIQYPEDLTSMPYSPIPKFNDGIPDHSTAYYKYSLDVFSNMVNKCLNQAAYRRTILLMIHANTQPDYAKVVSYAVALEAMAELIYNDNKEKMKPIPDRKLFSELRNNLQTVVKEIADRIGNEQTIKRILNSIDQLNKPSNRDKLLNPFKIYNIPLTKEDEEAIDKRNDFLHGRLPNESGSYELAIIGLRLQYCVNCLIMKYINYSGAIVNQTYFYQKHHNLDINCMPFQMV